MDEKSPAPAPKPSDVKNSKDKAPKIYDVVFDEESAAQHKADNERIAAATTTAGAAVAAEVVAAPDMENVEKVAKAAAAGKKPGVPATEYAVVSGNDKDDVKVSAIVFENIKAKKSLSVHHLQRRLREWGYEEAYADLDGWYGVRTRDAVHAFQKEHGLEVGDINLETLKAIFEGDTNVRVRP